jgi:hypothetical protein
MAKDEAGDETLEITVPGYALKAPVGFIARTFFAGQVATAEAFATLSRTATEKTVRGLPLTPEEQAVLGVVMAPILKKAARVAARVARAEQLVAAQPKALPGAAPTDAEPEGPSEAWRDRWVAGAEVASDDVVGEMWAHILAGEIRKPGSYSYKTLSTLKDLDTPTAKAFMRVIGCALQGTMIPQWKPFQASYIKLGVGYTVMMSLAEAGLLHSDDSVMNTDPTTPLLCRCVGVYAHLTGSAVQVPVHLLTRAGAEIAMAAKPRPRADCLEELGAWFRRMYVNVRVGIPDARGALTEMRPWTQESLVVSIEGSVSFAPEVPDEDAPA